MSEKIIRVVAELTAEQHRRLKIYCAKENVRMGEFVREAVIEKMKRSVYLDPDLAINRPAARGVALRGEVRRPGEDA